MSEHLSRITMRRAAVCGPVDNVTVITGYVVDFEPNSNSPPATKRDVLRPVAPDEPDTAVEVGYSRNALEPLTLVFRGKKVKLTEKPYCLFRYVYDLYRAEGQTEFEFAELSEALTGDECEMSQSAIATLIRRLIEALETISPSFTLTIDKETLCVHNKFVVEQ